MLYVGGEKENEIHGGFIFSLLFFMGYVFLWCVVEFFSWSVFYFIFICLPPSLSLSLSQKTRHNNPPPPISKKIFSGKKHPPYNPLTIILSTTP